MSSKKKETKWRDKGELVKQVYIGDDEILYRQFSSGAGSNLEDRLDKSYAELRDCRREAQSASNHAMIAFAILVCVYFGVIESLQSLGLKISQSSALHFALIASAALSFRSAYVQTRVTYLRAIFTAHLKRLNPQQKADWLARYPLGYNALQFYSPTIMWPDYLVPRHKKIIFEMVEAILIALGLIIWVFAGAWIALASCWRIVMEGDLSLFSIATVLVSLSLYSGTFFFPKYGSHPREYRHMGLINMFSRLEKGPDDRRERFLSRVAKGQANLGGDPKKAD